MNLIVGGDSVIGSALGMYWSAQGVAFHSSTRKKELESKVRPFIDLENIDLENLNYRYDSVVLCAAVSKLDECEQNPKKTRIINVYNTSKLAERFSNLGAFVLFLSTNQVFDGTLPFRKISDKRGGAVSEYGKQKSDAEDFISSLNSYGILRITKVMHPELSLLVKWRKSLENKEQISAFKDMYFSPVKIEKVIIEIDLIVKNRMIGIFHCSGGEDISYYDFASKYVKSLGYSEGLVNAVLCKKEGARYTSLSSNYHKGL